MAVSRSRSVPGFRPFTGVLVIIFHVVPASLPETNQPDHAVAMVDSDPANPAFARLQDRGHRQGLDLQHNDLAAPIAVCIHQYPGHTRSDHSRYFSIG